MQRIGFEISIRQPERAGDGNVTIACEDLGYMAIAEDLTTTISDFLELVSIDPALKDVPKAQYQATLNLERRELTFDFHPELFAALLSKVRKRRKMDLEELRQKLGFKSTGSVSKYFNISSPTMPQIDTLFRILEAMKLPLRISGV